MNKWSSYIPLETRLGLASERGARRRFRRGLQGALIRIYDFFEQGGHGE